MRILRGWYFELFLVLGLALAAGCGGAPPEWRAEVEGGGPQITDEGVRFAYYDTKANRVNLVGDFNNWSTTADPMFDREGDGIWVLTIPLEQGSYQYKYLIDGQKWTPDPANPDAVDDGFGGFNSVVVVP